MTTAFTINHLYKSYTKGLKNSIPTLHNISFSVQTGQVYGFVGPNGAGKSTTIKIAMDLLRADSGQILFFERQSTEVAARTKVGFVPEEPHLYDHLTGHEFLCFSARLTGLCRERIGHDAKKLLRRVGLEEASDRRLRGYSKGMQQRLVLAQALIGDPELIIMDEPLSGLDPVGRMQIQELIVDLRGQGKTIFFSSHILSDVENICDQVALIKDGEIKYDGSPENIERTFRAMLSPEVNVA